MPQITKDPLGNDVELLNLTEWSGKNNKELNEDTLTEYAGYATGQMLRAGKKPDEFQNQLYSGLFERGMREGVFQPQDEQQTTQLFESFANKPFVNDATDLDLVSKDLVSVDSEQAAKAADVYQRLQSGQQDPSLDTDLEDVRANVATLDKVQQARINFAKERGLAFIDYPTNEPGRRDVWVNTQAVPDRKSVYDTLDLARGIVDPRSAMLAEEYLKTDPGRTVNKAEQKVNWEIQSLIGKSDPNSELLKRLGTAIEWGSEAAEDTGVASTGAEMLKKAPVDTVTTPIEDVKVSIAPGPMGGMPIYTSKTGEAPIQKVDSNRIADAVIKNAYKALKEEEPNNPLITEYTEEQFLNAARDFVVQRLNVDTNQDDPTKNFVSLSDGTRVPFGSASLLPKERFNSAMDSLGFDEKERAVAAATRTGWIAANIDDIEQTLHDFEGSEYMDFVQNNRGQYENDRTKIAEAYIDNMKPSVWKTFWAKSRGVLRSVGNASYDFGSTLGLGLAKATNWDFAEQAYKDSLIASAENERRRGMFVGMYGGDMGMGYTIASQAAPLLTDILITKGAATLAKKGAKSVVTTGIRKTEDLFGTSAKSFIKDSLSEETRGLVGKYLTQFAVGGAEKSPARMLSAVRRDLERKFVAGTATATQIGTSFTRSAQNAWTNTTLRMSKETNADGTPKYTDEQINDAATTSALYSGFATALIERGFGKVFGEGADVTTVGAANIRQLKAYSKRLGGALERGGFGGTELYDTFKQISKEIVREGYGKAVAQIPGEALEEFTDEFTQNVIQSLLGDDTITVKQAFEQSLQAAVVGGVYGGLFGSTNKIGLFKADIARDTATGTAQSIQREIMDRTIARLKESGNADQTIAALQDRMRVSQRRDLPVSESIPERAAKQTIIDELDSLSEEPFDVPAQTAALETPPPPPNTVVTRLANKEAKELGVSEEELKTIQPSGNKKGVPQVTRNDVIAYVNRRTEQQGINLSGFLPGPNVTEPVDGFQLVGEDNTEDPKDRTFNDLKNRVVVIDGMRGRVRVEDEGVILDPEDGSTPFELTPNKDLPIKDFEGFNTLLQESAAVSPRRQPREVSDVKDDGQILYGDTAYDLPEKPFLANVKKDAEGNIESMHMRVFNSKGIATWVYVAGDNVPKVETAYRVRGPEAVTLFNNAVENTVKETARRNVSVDGYKAKQSKQRRKEKRAKNNAPFVSDQGQRAVESAPDFRATRIGQPDTPRQLVEEVRLVAAQLGLDPEVFTNDSELFQMVAPDMAAGIDLESFSPQQRARAVQNLQRNGNNPETLLEYLVSQEAEPIENRIARANHIAALRARNINQIKKHGIRPGADIKTVLQNIAKTATNKEHRQAAKELLRLGADAVPVAITSLPNNLEMAGAYLPQSNAVIVNLASDNSEGALGALLHELGHAVTDRVLTNPQNEFEQQIRERILALRAELSQRATEIHGNNIPYNLRYALEGRMKPDEPFSDVNGAREMVAHYYGSKTFRDHLVRLTNKGERSFVQKFIDLIASIFSGQPTASKQYRDLVRAITDLSKANQNLGANPYGRTAARVAASRAAVNQQNRVGTLFGVPNPHSRDDLEWILHQVQTLRYSDLSNEQINDLVKTQRFGMLTGENPNDTQFSDKENIEFNKNAVKWLREKGYPIIPIVGKYNRGENSFLVLGLTDQDAVDAAQELNQDSVVTNTGMYFRTGMVSPRVSEVTDVPIGEDDNYFSALLDTNGNVTTIRVEYDLDTTLDSGIRYSKQDQQAAPTTQIARSLAAQGEFQVVEDRESAKPISFSGGRITVNPTLAEQRYAGYDADDAADFQELDTRLAVAVGIANETNGPELQLDFEEFGLSPDAVIEQAAYNTLTSADLQDLLRVKEQAKQFVASAYYHIAIRNDGSNERLATAQNHIADLYRYLLRDGEAVSEVVEGFDPSGAGPITTQIAERAKPLQPIVRYSRAAVDIKPDEVRARTKAGKAVGTRNPTSAKATEDGADPNNLVDLATLKRNPQAYRKNALLLLEYPIVAREFPELAKEYAKIRGAVLKAQDKAKANGIKIKGEKDSAKKILANYLGVSKAKVSGKMLEDAIENPESAFVAKEQPGTAAANKEVRERNKALAKFNKNVERIKKYAAEGVKLGTDSSTALKTYTDTLDKIAKDPNHPIATRADEIYDTLIEVTKSNLRALMDVFPEDLRDIANLWYDGANIIAQQFAGDNYSLEQSSAVLAVFSPQKDWFQNVELAKRTMEIWTEDQDYAWDDAMSARWLMRGGEPELKENKDGTVGYAKGIKPDLDENGEHRTDENGMLLFHGWSSEKVKAKRQQAFERLQSLKGKKLKELTPEQQAWFIRMRAETKYQTSYPVVSPDGRFGKPSKSTNNKGVTKEIKLAWGTYGSIGKAINILTAPPETQMKVISDELGDQHKVRSFYNNIVDPQNNDGHVTMDTHAIAALFWQAFSGNSREVGQNFGTANTATDSLTGVGGLYPAFAEAYRQVAADYEMLPRQVQSITWEAVRMLFTARWKSNTNNVRGVRAKWVQYQNNEISLEQVQNAVFAMATNGKDLATAIANSNDEQLGLGFPSWADVTEGPAPAGTGVALSRAATQLDARYLELAKDPKANRDELQKLVDEAARSAGYSVGPVYHGSPSNKINVFEPENNRIYFTDDRRTANEYGKGSKTRKTYGAYLRATDVAELDMEGGSWQDNQNEAYEFVTDSFESSPPADMVILKNFGDTASGKGERISNVYVVPASAQVKSADPVTYDDNGNVIPLSQRFDLAKPDIRYSRAARVSEPVRLSKEQRTQSVELISSLTGADQKTRRGVFDGLVNLSNDDLLSVTERLNKKTLRWLIGSAAEDQSKVSLLSTLRRAVRKQIENTPQYQQGAALFREDGVRRVPVDRLAARVVLSRAATQLDADYIDAVNAGDLDLARQLVNKAVSTFSSQSKVSSVFNRHKEDKMMGLTLTEIVNNPEKLKAEDVDDYNSVIYWVSRIKQGDTPTVVVDANDLLWDGYHRLIAAKIAGSETINVIKTAKETDTGYLTQTVVRDSKGNVMPLSQRFQREPNVALSRAAAQLDADYMNAVESNDVETQQRLVDEAAYPAEFTIDSYHGTNGDLFTVFSTEMGGDKTFAESARLGIFSTDNADVAQSYAENIGAGAGLQLALNKGPLAEARAKAMSTQEFIKLSKKLDIAEKEYNKTLNRVHNQYLEKAKAPLLAMVKSGDLETFLQGKSETEINKFIKDTSLVIAQGQFVDDKAIINNPELAAAQDKINEISTAIHNYVYPFLRDSLPNVRVMKLKLRIKNPKVYDAEGKTPANFSLADKIQEAKDSGHDGVIFRNIIDPVGRVDTNLPTSLPATHYVVFDPEQIKSADPVTYDDNGNVIPLSQRFDLTKPDIRYSRAAGADTAPKAFRGRTVQLTHWSTKSELKQTDPNEHGNGGAGAEWKYRREYGEIYPMRTYFGYGKYHRESQVGRHRYSMLVDGDSLYDLDRDPLDLYPGQEELQKAGYARFDKRAAITLYEKAIKDAGYKGYVSTSFQAGVLFQKQKVTKVKDGNTSLPLAAPGEPDTTKKPRYSKALYAISSPDPESSYMVSVDDLYINNVTGEWDAGNGVVSRLFRAAGDIDPRMFEASKYQERGLRLAKIRLKDMAQAFKKALKKEPNADLDDVNLALGSTEPTVSAAQRSAAESVKKAQIDAANAAFDTAPANAAYAAAVQAARVNYASHRDKAKYTAEVQQAREARKNSPEMAAREVAIAAAEAKYNADIQAARRSNLKGLHAAQAQAQLRLEQNSPETAKAVAEMRVAIDRLSSQLSAELGTNDPLRAVIDQNIGIYLTRSYKIHQEEGYAQRILEDSEFAHQRAQARAFFEKQWVRDTYERWRADVAYEPYTDAEVMALVRQEARDKDVGTRALNDFVDRHGSTPKTFSRAMTRTDLTRFMQKGEVPAELRPILGEIQNPFENALRTYGNLAQFLGTQRLLNQYAKLGVDNGWLVPAKDVEANQDKYRGYKPLVNTTDTKGGDPLAEYYAEPDVVEAFQTMFAPPAPANRSTQRKLIDGVINIAGRAIGASMGALTLGSASFFVRNITGILSFVTANGFIPSPSNINASRLAIKQIYGKNLEGLGADMVMLGVAEGSMTSQAMRDFMRGVIDDPDVISNQIESTIRELGTPGSALLRTLKKSKAAVDALATLNDQIDLFYKAMYFAHEVDVQTKANKHRAVPYTPQQIKQEAARTVRLTTQGRERVAPIFKEFGRSGLGMLFNSFFRFTAEIFRLPASTVQLGVSEYKSGNPVLKARGIKRLMGLGAALAMTHGAADILKSMFGVDDDEEETVRASQPPYGRDGNLFITVNENEGTLSTWDLTYTNPFSPISDPIGRSFQHIVRGDWEKVPGVIFKSLADSFLSPQIAVEAVGQAFYNVDDYGRPLWLESDPFTYKAQKFLKHVAGNAYKLRTPTQFWKAYQAYTNGGIYDKDARFEKTSDLLVNEFMPFRIQTHKFEQTALKAFRTVKAELDKGRAALSVFGSYEDLDQQRVDDAYERYDKVQASVNQKLYDYSNGLMGFGLSYSELEKLAYEVGISKRRFEQAVRYKRYERYMPSKDALKGYEKAGGENNGAARVQFIRGAVYSRPQYTPLND